MQLNVDWEHRLDWNLLRKERVQRLAKVIAECDLDGLLLAKLDNVRYVTSFRPVYSMYFQGSRYMLLISKHGEMIFLVASGDYERVRTTMRWLTEVRPFPFDVVAGAPMIVKAISDLKLNHGKIGIDMIPMKVYLKLVQSIPTAHFVDGWSVMDQAKMIKQDEEVKILRSAAEVADIGMVAALGCVRDTVRELDVAAEATHAMIAAGSEDLTNVPLVESGAHSWSGYRFPTEKRIRPGELVYIDTGDCIINGYNGDTARITVVSRPTVEQKKVYTAIYRMLQASIKTIKPGTSVKEIVAAAKKVAAEEGYADYTYLGILGHGIGTDLHEPPIIGDRVAEEGGDVRLEANMVLALEPGILVPNVGGGHLEDMVLVNESGHETLTKTEFNDALML